MNLNKTVQQLKAFKPAINPKYSAYADQVINLFKDRKIEKTKEAEKLLIQLGSRGKAPATAIKKIQEKYSIVETAKGKLTRATTQNFFITGAIQSSEIYTRQFKRTGEIKEKGKYKLSDNLFTSTIRAKNRSEAEKIFVEQAKDNYSSSYPDRDSNTNRRVQLEGVAVSSVVPLSSFTASNDISQLMKASRPLEYSFVPADNSLLKNDGFCVLDQFLGIYSGTIKHLTKEYFINQCYKVRGEEQPATKEISFLDVGIEGLEDEDRPDAWNISKGVSPDMLRKICEILDISHYCYDITRKCFSKFVSKNRNFKALIYYCINNHMYWISDPEKANQLVKRAQDIETKTKSHCVVEDEKKSENIYTREIFENIPVEDLNKYDKATIIYSKGNLNEELDQIIKQENFIPEIMNHRYNITQIKYTKGNKDLILVIDPNIEHGMTFKIVRQLCNTVDILFINQSFSNLVKQLSKRFFDSKVVRHQPTKDERQKLLDKADGCCCSCKKEVKKVFHIDHIIPLAEGGSNESENLQVLCKPCHFEKTRTEQENGYVRLSNTESSFNSTVKDIFNSSLNTKHAFVEKLKEEIPVKLQNNKIHFFDKVRCRKTCLYYNQYDYPLFTVIDEPVFYKGEKKAGLYFVESTNYLPLRGNGWYSQPTIEYCLKAGIIVESDIKHAIYSSLSIPKNYYNKFIDYLEVFGEHSKLAVNSMIGCFKPKIRENWKSLLITTNPNSAYAHFIEKNGCFIDSRLIGDQTYYQVYNRFFTNREETEAPIYNQILEQEAIEVHKLKTIIEKNGGVVLDVSTDSISCVFKTDASPFELEQNKYIKGFYDDEEQKNFSYRNEDKEGRLQNERMKLFARTEYYYHIKKMFNIETDNDDFLFLVNMILSNGKSIHIDGRAGCGKTTLIKMLQAEMTKRGILYKSLAPTNKACRLINGETLHRFSAKATGSYIRETKIKYIFIDEVSMMAEMFYKFFIVFQRMRPDIKFIIAGDFAQLLPVKDRIENCDYKNSLALHELCDGNRLQLTKCRRSDSTLFNLLLPDNIGKIKKTDFKNEITSRHICFTNKKRIEINRLMMDKMIKQKKVNSLELKGLDYDPNSQDVRLCSGMPLISRKNNKELNIFNNETFTIKEIRKKEQIIIIQDEGKEQEIPISQFVVMFNVAFCLTCHRVQGMSIDEPYSIWEFNLFDNRLKYVALSRATDINLINIV